MTSVRGEWYLRVGVVSLGFLVMVALLAPFLAPHDPTTPLDLANLRLAPPGDGHWLGTDRLSRDVLSRILYGARISLSVGLLGSALAVILGTVVGGMAGYFGGWPDRLLMAGVDVILAFPRLVLVIAVVALTSQSIPLIIGVLGFTLWPPVARLVRAQVLSVRERGYVTAARALGYSRGRILFRHVLPNALAPVVVAATLGVGDAIVLEAGLSFLGLGVPPPTPSWGAMVLDGLSDPVDSWWVATFAGLAIVVTVLSVNVLGEGLRGWLERGGGE
jgi:peptide/nickel transport system permease protein